MVRRRKLEFRIGGRYGYSAVDVYDKKTGSMITTAIAGVTKKEAEIIAGAMENVQDGYYNRLAKSAEERQKKKMEKEVV